MRERAPARPRPGQAHGFLSSRKLPHHQQFIATVVDHLDGDLGVAAGFGFEYSVSVVQPDSRFETVKYLVDELKASVNSTDELGYTPLHGAAYVGDNDVVKYLVARGANVTAKSLAHVNGNVGPRAFPAPEGKGDTVVDMANGPRQHARLHPETIALLESLGAENSDNCRAFTCVLKVNAPGFAKKPN